MAEFLEDLKRKELIPVKILAFCIYGGQASLYPFLTLHLMSLGLSFRSLAIIFALQPAISLIIQPCILLITARVANVKGLFVFFLIFSAVAVNCLQLVPSVNFKKEGELKIELTCGNNSSTKNEKSTLFLLPQLSCAFGIEKTSKNSVKLSSNVSALTLVIDYCQLDCTSQRNLNEKDYLQFCFTRSPDEPLCVPQSSFKVFRLTNWTLTTDSNNSSKLLHEISHTEYGGDIFNGLTCKHKQKLFPHCKVVCNGTVEDDGQICTDLIERKFSGWATTFWQYMGVRSLISISNGMVNGLFDASTSFLVAEYQTEFKFQRFWSTLGACIMAPIVGLAVGRNQPLEITPALRKNALPEGDFTIGFYVSSGLFMASALATSLMDLSVKDATGNAAFSLIRNLLNNFEIILLLVGMGILGTCWGFLENYFFLFLDAEFNAHKFLLGAIVTLSSLTVLVLCSISVVFSEKLEPYNVITFSFIIYSVRFFAYAYVTGPYWCLLLEVLGAFSIAVLTIGVTLYCTKLVPLPMLATIMMLWNAVHSIIGRSLGGVTGGLLVAHLGWKKSFFSFGCVSLTAAIISFIIIHILVAKKKNVTMDGINNTIPEVKSIRNRVGVIASLYLSYNESTGCSCPASTSILLPSLSQSQRSIGLNEISLRTMRNSVPAGDKPKATSSRRNSLVANYRSSLASVPEEHPGHESPDLNENKIGRFTVTTNDIVQYSEESGNSVVEILKD